MQSEGNCVEIGFETCRYATQLLLLQQLLPAGGELRLQLCVVGVLL